jgi:hypothetical protein
VTIPDGASHVARDGSTRPGRAWRFIRDNLAVTLTLAGLLVYSSLRLSAGIFYGRFGFTPEDVGLGYAEILARSLYTLILLTAYGGLLIFATLWIAGALLILMQRAAGSLLRREHPGASTGPHWLTTGSSTSCCGRP